VKKELKYFVSTEVLSPIRRIIRTKYRLDKYRKSNKLLYGINYLIYAHYQMKFGVQIPARTKIGENFMIGHVGGIVVNSGVLIGNRVKIMQGVLLGEDYRGHRKGTPVIGDNVFIGANAVIVGKITIGDDVLIAPNSYVNFDVPPHSIVIGNPGKIISRDNATDGYLEQFMRI
jgi:serine O-acetyltransferase